MSTFKKGKVVMLPTNQKSRLFKGGGSLNYLSHTVDDGEGWRSSQHLYIISDDEIKKGDWIITNIHNKIEQVLNNQTSLKFYQERAKKVIATTDTTLKIDNPNYDIGRLAYINLPQPSQQFIQKFVEEYNKGNIINEVMVEYDTHPTIGKIIDNIAYPGMGIEFLKINLKDNTIAIKKAKDSWNREEVIELCKQAFIDGTYTGGFGPNEKTINSETEKWIEENL